MRINKWLISTITVVIIVIAVLLVSAAYYISTNFPNQNIDEMLFYLSNGMKGVSTDVFETAISASVVPFIMVIFIILIPVLRLGLKNNIIEVSVRKKVVRFTLLPVKLIYRFRILYATLILIISLSVCYNLMGIGEYLKRSNEYSPFIRENYVDGEGIAITFPAQKRNLIVLYLESMENSMIDVENGGGWAYNVIPELTSIAADHVNFSNSDKIGGPYQVAGTGWTVAGMVSTSSGIPLKVPVNGNDYTSSENFLRGVTALGDLLKREGYNLELIVGSDARFGGRSNYYLKHGNYEIFDLNTAINEGKMHPSDKVWWGFEDSRLFNWAKDEILELANKQEPFSVSILTANTHFEDGYVEEGTEDKYPTQYENVFAFSSKQVSEFVNWLKEQDFYSNTTLVIIGDHLSMQSGGYFESHTYEGYARTMYNAIVNPALDPIRPKNRVFSPFDIYPTMLGSIGVDIEGNRIGLGTNLFSDRRTLVEKYGLHHFATEIAKNSNFYNSYILQDDYLDLLKKANQDK